MKKLIVAAPNLSRWLGSMSRVARPRALHGTAFGCSPSRGVTPLACLLPVVLAGCQPCEGPVVVSLVDMDDTAVVSWAEAEGDFTACTPGVQENGWDCGPDDDEYAGTLTIMVEWNDGIATQDVEVTNDGSCMGNEQVSFAAEDFGVNE